MSAKGLHLELSSRGSCDLSHSHLPMRPFEEPALAWTYFPSDEKMKRCRCKAKVVPPLICCWHPHQLLLTPPPPLLRPTPPPPHPAPLTCCSVAFQPYRSFSVQRLTVGSARWRRCLKNKPEAQLEGHIKQNITGALRMQEEPISFPRYWACTNFPRRITTFAVFVNSTEDIKCGSSVEKEKKRLWRDQLFIIGAEDHKLFQFIVQWNSLKRTNKRTLSSWGRHQTTSSCTELHGRAE